MSKTIRRRFAQTTFVLGFAGAIVGCGVLDKLKKQADAGIDASAIAEEEVNVADAATVTVAGTGAKNEKDVLRYAKEEKLSDEVGTVGKDGTKVKTFPGNGVEVATLAKGTAVTKKAKFFATGVLITFDDPAGDGTKLMGWVPPEALATPGAVASATATTPTTPVTPVPTTVKDAGAPIKDAGATADAGKAGADAGSGAAPVGKATLAVPPGADGKCPGGFSFINSLCRRTCNADGDCPPRTFCISSAGKKYCSATK